MNRFTGTLIFISILIAAVTVTGCSSRFVPPGEESVSPPPSPSGSPSHMPVNGMVQSHTGGSVTIDVEWMGMENGLLTFAVAMNTHSVDLDGYDLGELAVLRDDEGNEYHPSSWHSAPGGHHRKGTLTFPIPDSLSQGSVQYLELSIRDVAGVGERFLKWKSG